MQDKTYRIKCIQNNIKLLDTSIESWLNNHDINDIDKNKLRNLIKDKVHYEIRLMSMLK